MTLIRFFFGRKKWNIRFGDKKWLSDEKWCNLFLHSKYLEGGSKARASFPTTSCRCDQKTWLGPLVFVQKSLDVFKVDRHEHSVTFSRVWCPLSEWQLGLSCPLCTTLDLGFADDYLVWHIEKKVFRHHEKIRRSCSFTYFERLELGCSCGCLGKTLQILLHFLTMSLEVSKRHPSVSGCSSCCHRSPTSHSDDDPECVARLWPMSSEKSKKGAISMPCPYKSGVYKQNLYR